MDLDHRSLSLFHFVNILVVQSNTARAGAFFYEKDCV
jgi:hypothetical protein